MPRHRHTAEEIATILSDFVNGAGPDELEEFARQVLLQHRTLQQLMFGAFLNCIERWSKLDENWYDARNEYTVKLSKDIMTAIKDKWFGRCPLI